MLLKVAQLVQTAPRRPSPELDRLSLRAASTSRCAARRRQICMSSSSPANCDRVIALDFDGVICDSVGESAQSAWKAAEKLWPELFLAPSAAAEKPRVLDGMRLVRPVVETGYENLVQVRMLLERRATPDEMLDNWGKLLPAHMQLWGLQRADLVERFGATRDEWMKADLAGWLGANGLYDGVPEVLRALLADPSADVSIVTTKQARFTARILADMARAEIPMERIYSQTVSGAPKSEVLIKLAESATAAPGARLIFVEDKMSTLLAVAATPGLERWELALVDWGYNTKAERAAAAAHPRITLVDVAGFERLLSSGGK